MKVAMVIPTYWGRESSIGQLEGDLIFDHPTPLDEDGTLGRTLKSLEVLKNRDFELFIIVVPTNEEITDAVYEKVEKIVRDSVPSDVNFHLFGPYEVKDLERMTRGEYSNILRLNGYSDVRNMCIIAPFLRGSDVIIFIDDDEVFERSDFVDIALAFMGEEFKGERVYAKAGYYLQADGGYFIKKPFKPYMRYWDQYGAMNEAFRKFTGTDGRLKVVPFVFGGNMVLHREIFTKIPFDPGVPRGEDIDYLINARMWGYKFFLDRELSIKHLPPP